MTAKNYAGSIEAGQKRGEAAVQAAAHTNLQTVAQDYYSGEKESEVPIVRELLNKSGLAAKKITLDALHCKPQTLEIMVKAGGSYLVGLKENQKELKKQAAQAINRQAFLFRSASLEKGHGRIETREYEFYDLSEMKKAERRNESEIRTAIAVNRRSEELKSGKQSCEKSYYLTNEAGKYEEIAEAMRKHWSVETNNHLRDVSLKEDRMRSKKRVYSEQWEGSELCQQ